MLCCWESVREEHSDVRLDDGCGVAVRGNDSIDLGGNGALVIYRCNMYLEINEVELEERRRSKKDLHVLLKYWKVK